jgi:hydrogenase maturation protease
MTTIRTLILGIGNLLLGDEGVGVHVAQSLIASGVPPGVVVLDVGTAILDVLPHLEAAERLVVVDAVKADGKPGTVYRMPLEAFVAPASIASMHGFDLSRVLALTDRTDRPEVLVVGIEPAAMDWSLELSPAVKAALPVVIEVIRKEFEGGR